MQTHPIRWNAAALEVPTGSDPDRDARYRLMRSRQLEATPQARPSLLQRLTGKAAA